ncbi:MAG: ABC transporter permease [Deltaproteobacteria bacterium]|nr:ABC transporter permease [Deltaproteobacteria bacterium]
MNLTMAVSVLRRVWQNISSGLHLHMAVTSTVTFSLLIIGAFAILYLNINDLIRSWQENIKVVAYLKDAISDSDIEHLRREIVRIDGIAQIRFVSKDAALARLKTQLKHRQSILDGLRENPLPASLEIRLVRPSHNWEQVEQVARQIAVLRGIKDVEYNKPWLQRFLAFTTFFKLASIIIGGFVFATAVFVSSNTIKLALYTKAEEVEIMRLVGATDRFIKTPFYLQNLIEGILGALIALGILFGAYKFFVARVQTLGVWLGPFQVRFLPRTVTGALVVMGMLIGWFSSYFSLKHFLRS